MIALAIVITIASPGETIVEKNRLKARRESNFKNIPRIAKKKIISSATHCESNIIISIASSMSITSESTVANQENLPSMIIPRLIGFERMR
jgi:hypothetical protein